jgi:hypothetical protein
LDFIWLDLYIYIDVEEVSNKTLNGIHNGEKIAAHDTLNYEQISTLRENQKGKTIIFVLSFLLYFWFIVLTEEEEDVSEEDTQEVDVSFELLLLFFSINLFFDLF